MAKGKHAARATRRRVEQEASATAAAEARRAELRAELAAVQELEAQVAELAAEVADLATPSPEAAGRAAQMEAEIAELSVAVVDTEQTVERGRSLLRRLAKEIRDEIGKTMAIGAPASRFERTGKPVVPSTAIVAIAEVLGITPPRPKRPPAQVNE